MRENYGSVLRIDDQKNRDPVVALHFPRATRDPSGWFAWEPRDEEVEGEEHRKERG